MRGVLYYLHNGDGMPRYIGITSQKPEHRLQRHTRTAERGAMIPVSDWIRKYGSASIQIVVVAEMGIQALREAEKEMIAELRKTGNCLNVTDGGEGSWGMKHSEEAKAKIAAARVGTKATEETKAKLSAVHKGKPTWNKGIPQAEHLNKAQSERMKGRPKTTNHHTRWHTNRNIIKPDCAYCSTETLELRQNV